MYRLTSHRPAHKLRRLKVRADPCKDAVRLVANANLGVVVAAYGAIIWLPPKYARVNKPTSKDEYDGFSSYVYLILTQDLTQGVSILSHTTDYEQSQPQDGQHKPRTSSRPFPSNIRRALYPLWSTVHLARSRSQSLLRSLLSRACSERVQILWTVWPRDPGGNSPPRDR